MGSYKLVYCLVLLGYLLVPKVVFGQLSQLTFDGPAPSEQSTPVVDPEDLLKTGEVLPSRTGQGQPSGDYQTILAEGSLEALVGEMFIVPRLRGPFVDDDNDSSIVSRSAWNRNRRGTCTGALTKADVCKKSKAVREVLQRFSGTDEFAKSVCQSSCAASGERSMLSALTTDTAPGMGFDIIAKGGQCHYQISKRGEENWMVMRPRQVSCSCLPVSCWEY